MPNSPIDNQWDQLVVKMGTLTLASGCLEMAVIAIVCGILGKSEDQISGKAKWPSNKWWCDKLHEVAPTSWDKQSLVTCLTNIRELYKRRNRMIHAALGVVSDASVPGAVAGSVIDLRTYGWGFRSNEGNTCTIGIVGKRFELHELDELTQQIHNARLSLVPFMELADEIRHKASLPPAPELGKRLW
jgi:hypothetical protein